MSGRRRFEVEASEKLLAAADTAPTEAAYAAFNAAAVAVQFGDADLVARMQDIARLILAAEVLVDAAAALVKGARAALAECMASAGATTIRTDGHTVSLAEGKHGVVITEPAAIPQQFMRAPTPDRDAIGRALRAGEQVPGAVLSNGGPPYLSFHRRATPRKEQTA